MSTSINPSIARSISIPSVLATLGEARRVRMEGLLQSALPSLFPGMKVTLGAMRVTHSAPGVRSSFSAQAKVDGKQVSLFGAARYDSNEKLVGFDVSTTLRPFGAHGAKLKPDGSWAVRGLNGPVHDTFSAR